MALLSNPSRIDLGLCDLLCCFFFPRVFICGVHVETHDCTHWFPFVLVETKKSLCLGKMSPHKKKSYLFKFSFLVDHTKSTEWWLVKYSIKYILVLLHLCIQCKVWLESCQQLTKYFFFTVTKNNQCEFKNKQNKTFNSKQEGERQQFDRLILIYY